MKKFVGQWLKRLIKIFSYKNLETAVEESVSSNSNVHIEEYLEFFLGLKHPPEFAVLLSGPWGIGKTHLVKRMLGPMFAGEDAKFAYVSLYGVTSVEQISWEILGQIYPALNSRAGKLGRRLLEAGLKNLPFDAELKPGEIPVLNKPELYVFDDLERADMPLDSILGFINTLVEHDGEKVVLIANETELDRRNGVMVISGVWKQAERMAYPVG
ncbi:hypothetical protein C9993_07435 [Marinobacter sp. Z-F4-2]|nr:hypothetical protein C9993_07435 [Marinobacter sp. Z-F4-2]